jgi:hypothetical protein
MISVEALAERFDVIVRTLNKRLASHVVHHRLLWGTKFCRREIN